MNTQPFFKKYFTLFLLAGLFITSAGRGLNPQSIQKISPSAQNKSALPSLGSCQIFSADNYWNTPVDTLPVHPLSSQWVNSIGSSRGFHMDFGSGNWDGGPIGIPYNVISGASVTKYTLDFNYSDESDPGPYPLSSNPAIEWGSDHHILTVDTHDCKLYEIYKASKQGGQWSGGSGAIWDLGSKALRPDTWTSADAAGLPILPGLARYDEVLAGEIDHALRFTTNCTANYYIWPARHVAQSGSCANPVPFGARFRLKAGYDISGYSSQARVILQAMKTYGIVLADNGSPWYVSGAPDNHWDNDQLHELDALTGDDFEAVNTYSLMADPNTSQVSNTINQPTQQILNSVPAKDGWILESSETSGKGGSQSSGSTTLRLGDNAQNEQYRSILNFDTSNLPNGTIIYSATLKVKEAGVTGKNPFNILGELYVDIRSGVFGSSSNLQTSDFQAVSSKNNAAKLSKSAQAGWHSALLDGGIFNYLDLNGSTQFRLRFKKDDNNNSKADFINFYSGDASSDQPQLVIEYYLFP